jgi:hypothetical protein
LGALVNAASEKDGESLLELIKRKKQTPANVKLIYADPAYNRLALRSGLEEKYGIQLEIVSVPRNGI